MKVFFASLVFLWTAGAFALAARAEAYSLLPSKGGSAMLDDYFREETRKLADDCLSDVRSLEDWMKKREQLRAELFDMMGLSPLPPRTPLNPVITGTISTNGIVVEKLHFQSMPGLYVTANLYLPAERSGPLPGVLYLCGHAVVKKGAISYGNKAGYQHHGAWFARNGYACLMIDTIQLGEIEGVHHGTYREKLWWWNSRGYSPAGVEAWNGIRALDYMQSRPEIDGSRLGVTGRSGGGAYSWWVAALDERARAAAPVAGITDLENHVVDDKVEGHCDCMYFVNTYRWDYPAVAALVAPRPLLICNSDKDSIFPLDGVVRTHEKTARIYQLYGASTNLGLLITEGPHKDTQDLQLPVFRWFNRHLKGEEPLVEMAAVPFFTPEQLKVFADLPGDERTSRIHESFVPMAPESALLVSADERQTSAAWREILLRKVFAGWPAQPGPINLLRAWALETNSTRLEAYEFDSQPAVRLRLFALRSAEGAPKSARLRVLNEKEWPSWAAFLESRFAGMLAPSPKTGSDASRGKAIEEIAAEVHGSLEAGETLVLAAPRGVGPSAWEGNERARTHIRRRFMLLGQTLDSMRVWDIRRAVAAARAIPDLENRSITVEGTGEMAVNALYAVIFEPSVKQFRAGHLPDSHRQGPDYLNVLRFLDIPQALKMAAVHAEVTVNRRD